MNKMSHSVSQHQSEWNDPFMICVVFSTSGDQKWQLAPTRFHLLNFKDEEGRERFIFSISTKRKHFTSRRFDYNRNAETTAC